MMMKTKDLWEKAASLAQKESKGPALRIKKANGPIIPTKPITPIQPLPAPPPGVRPENMWAGRWNPANLNIMGLLRQWRQSMFNRMGSQQAGKPPYKIQPL